MSRKLITHLTKGNKVFGTAGAAFEAVAAEVRRHSIFDFRYDTSAKQA